MARIYKRDSRGRFSGTGGGGKMGKSVKNEKARAKYKEAASKARSAERNFGGSSPAAGTKFGKRQVAGAKSGLTRVTQSLRGGAKGNIGRTTKDKMSEARQTLAGMAKTQRGRKTQGIAKPSAGLSRNQVAKGRAAKAAYESKSASKRKAATARKGGSFVKTSTFKNSLKAKQAAARTAKKAAMR